MSARTPEILLFDLGGVLIDIDFERALRAWQPMSRLPPSELKRRFVFDAAYERHERGEITAAQYYDHLAAMLELEADHAAIEQGWNSIFVGEISETMAAIRGARERIPCYAFSNTNAAHRACWSRRFASLGAALDGIFTSYEIGLRKPEQRAFAHVAQAVRAAPGSILFFDDSPDNVAGAARAGLQAVHVRRPADVREALRAIGCDPPGQG